jgi:hypothetical protein
MTATVPFLAIACGASFVVSFALFLITTVQRNRLDVALTRAATVRSQATTALDPPERRPTYDQNYLIAFIEDARSQDIANGRSALDFYAETILAWDIWFAVAFAVFIALAGLLAADWLAAWPWAARACLVLACMGILYGMADVAEDLTLRKIFRHAEELAAMRRMRSSMTPSTEASDAKYAALDDAALADAAQTDAANALTRLKMVTITASLIGVFVFELIFMSFDQIMKNAAAPAPKIVLA